MADNGLLFKLESARAIHETVQSTRKGRSSRILRELESEEWKRVESSKGRAKPSEHDDVDVKDTVHLSMGAGGE